MKDVNVIKVWEGTFEHAPLYVVVLNSQVICVTRDYDVISQIAKILGDTKE